MRLIYSTPGFHQYIAYHDKNWTVEIWLRFLQKESKIRVLKHGDSIYHVKQDYGGKIHCAIPLPKFIEEYINIGISFILEHNIDPPTQPTIHPNRGQENDTIHNKNKI